MVSDEMLTERLQQFLKSSDLNVTTTAMVRRKLEEDFRVDLSDRKPFIREQVNLFLQSRYESSQEGEEQEDDDDETTKSKLDSCDGDDDEGDESNNGKGSKRGSQRPNNEGKKKGGGFNKLCALSPQLQEFLGVTELARTEVVKQVWAYIKEKKLQDPSNRRNVICNEQLHSLFGVDSINMFQLNKALSKHIVPLDSDDVKSTPKEKQSRQDRDEDSYEPRQEEKRQKSGGKSGFIAPYPVSDALVNFLGIGENKLSRADAVKRIWDYIKENNLQDPSDKKMIICDEKLKELFGVESFHGFTVSKLLSSHFIKPEH